jgi:hypothetical protein
LTISEGREGKKTEERGRVRKQIREREGGVKDKAGRDVNNVRRWEG